MKRKFVVEFALLVAGFTAAGVAIAQGFPSRSIRLVVGYPPGGLTDGVARTLAPRLSETLGQQVFVDNRGGGGSTIGTDIVAKAAPDGHTLLVADQAFITNPSLYAKLPFDTLKDFQPVSLVGAASLVILVHPSLPVRSIKELVALAKSRPGDINYASGGNGTATHLAGELFKQVAGVNFVHIPYKGAGLAIIDVLSGQVSLMFGSIGGAAPQVAAGKIKALAVTGNAPIAVLPGVPTLAEAGYPAASVVGYWGVLAPVGVARDVLDKLSGAIAAAVKRPEVRQRLLDQGVDPTGSGPGEYERIIRAEIGRWAKVIKEAGIKVD
ncbi:MAG TPA: tripartite tricarboxylate transporter substrate binding protein [Burkholderiales bacterium]|nr:tripartite tricarboxylate transporter substrate binding protein [Burkholderiales bacterium]